MCGARHLHMAYLCVTRRGPPKVAILMVRAEYGIPLDRVAYTIVKIGGKDQVA